MFSLWPCKLKLVEKKSISVDRSVTKRIMIQWRNVCAGCWFFGFGVYKDVVPHLWCTHRRLDHVIWSRNNQDMFPQIKGGPFAGKNLEQTLVILITKHVSPYEIGVNNWNMDKFWPLIKLDENEICWIHYVKRFIIHLLLRSMLKKKWKNL